MKASIRNEFVTELLNPCRSQDLHTTQQFSTCRSDEQANLTFHCQSTTYNNFLLEHSPLPFHHPQNAMLQYKPGNVWWCQHKKAEAGALPRLDYVHTTETATTLHRPGAWNPHLLHNTKQNKL
jgi:hypothetical protein